MSIFLKEFHSSIIPIISSIESEPEKTHILEVLQTVCNQPTPTNLSAIRIISTLGEELANRLQQLHLNDVSEKVALTAEDILINLAIAMQHSREDSLSPSPLGEAPPHKRHREVTLHILEDLPREVLLNIFQFVEPCANVALTCRVFRDCSNFFKAQQIIQRPTPRISLREFGLVVPRDIISIPEAQSFLDGRQKILDIMKRQLPLPLQHQFDITPRPVMLSAFIDVTYDYQLFLLFGAAMGITNPKKQFSIALTHIEAASLRDKIAKHAKALTTLEYTDIDPPLTCLPKAIRFCVNLTGLHITDSQIRTIPSDIKALKKLTSLRLERNCLESLPEALGECENLQHLNVGYNLLKTIPLSVLSLPKLQTLIVDDDVELPPGFEQTHSVARAKGQPLLHYRREVCAILGIPTQQ